MSDVADRRIPTVAEIDEMGWAVQNSGDMGVSLPFDDVQDLLYAARLLRTPGLPAALADGASALLYVSQAMQMPGRVSFEAKKAITLTDLADALKDCPND